MDTQSSMVVSSLTDSLNQALSRASVYEAPGMSGAAGFGFSPGQSESAWLRDRALRQQTYALDVGRESMRNKAFANILAENRPDNSWRQSGMQLFSTMMNSPQFAAMTGGSDFDMLAGAQAAVGASGFRIGGARTFGGGALSDRVAYDVWKNADSTFFDKNGVSRLEKTQGFDRTQLGQLFSVLGQRGAWSGLDLAKDVTMEDGKYKVNYNENALSKVQDGMGEAAKALRTVQDVVGGRPMQELIKIAENIAGVAAGSAKFAEQVQKRMASVMAMTSFGINPMAAMNFQGSIAESLTQLGFSGTSGAAISPEIMRYSLMNQQTSKEFSKTSGFYMTPATAGESAAGMAAASASMMKDHKMQGLALGLYMADKGLIKDQGLLALLQQDKPSETTLEEIYKGVRVASGGNIAGTLARFGGMDKVMGKLSPEAHDRYASASTNTLLDRSTDQRLRADLRSQGQMIDKFTGSPNLRTAAIDAQAWLAATLETENGNQTKFVEIVDSAATDTQKKQQLRTLLSTDSGAANMSAADITKRVDAAVSQSAYYKQVFGLSSAFRELDPAMRLSKGDRANLNRIIDVGGKIFENQTPVGDMTGDMLRGFFNSATPDPEKLMIYGMMSGDITKLDPAAVNGNRKEQAAAKKAVREMLKSANPEISEGDLKNKVEGAWKDLQAGGSTASRRVETMGQAVQAKGGLARRNGDVMYTMSRKDKEHRLANWSKQYESQALEDVQRSLGTWDASSPYDTEEEGYKRAAGAALFGENKDFEKLSVLNKDRVGQATGALKVALTEDMNNAKAPADKKAIQTKIDTVNEYMATSASGNPMAMRVVMLLKDILDGIKGIGKTP